MSNPSRVLRAVQLHLRKSPEMRDIMEKEVDEEGQAPQFEGDWRYGTARFGTN